MNKIQIRKLAKQDQEQWQKLWQSYLDFYQTSKKPEIYQTTFNRLTDNDFQDCEGFVAFIDDKMIGLVHLIYHTHLWQQEKICYLQDLFVDVAYRKQGIATKLIQFSYSHADKKGLKGVYWLTHESNGAARKVYDKVALFSGFVKYVKK